MLQIIYYLILYYLHVSLMCSKIHFISAPDSRLFPIKEIYVCNAVKQPGYNAHISILKIVIIIMVGLEGIVG